MDRGAETPRTEAQRLAAIRHRLWQMNSKDFIMADALHASATAAARLHQVLGKCLWLQQAAVSALAGTGQGQSTTSKGVNIQSADPGKSGGAVWELPLTDEIHSSAEQLPATASQHPSHHCCDAVTEDQYCQQRQHSAAALDDRRLVGKQLHHLRAPGHHHCTKHALQQQAGDYAAHKGPLGGGGMTCGTPEI